MAHSKMPLPSQPWSIRIGLWEGRETGREANIEIDIDPRKLGNMIEKAMNNKRFTTKLQGGGIVIRAVPVGEMKSGNNAPSADREGEQA